MMGPCGLSAWPFLFCGETPVFKQNETVIVLCSICFNLKREKEIETMAKARQIQPGEMRIDDRITTEQVAKLFGVTPGTVRRGLCVNGHYLGLRPIKLPNRRLLWPGDALRRVMAGAEV
jgi:hypothetical protein